MIITLSWGWMNKKPSFCVKGFSTQYFVFTNPFCNFCLLSELEWFLKRLLNPVILIETDELIWCIRLGRNHFAKTKILNLRFFEISMKKLILFEKERALCSTINGFLFMIEFIGLHSLYLFSFHVALWNYRITYLFGNFKGPFPKVNRYSRNWNVGRSENLWGI